MTDVAPAPAAPAPVPAPAAPAPVPAPVPAAVQPLTVAQAVVAVATAPTDLAPIATEPVEEAPEAEVIPDVEPVTVVITEAGSGLIFKGELIGGVEQTFQTGDEVTVEASAALVHEARGLVSRA